MKRFSILFLVVFYLCFTACDKKVLDNPFDRNCPKELFTPSNFKAEQENNIIKLTWEQNNLNISGFKVSRSENQGVFREITDLGKAEAEWSDDDIAGGIKYGYQLYAYAGDNNSNTQTAYVTPVFNATLTTSEATNITSSNAVSGGNITSDGGSAIISRGICYSTTHNPTITNAKTNDGTGKDSFISHLTGLSVSTAYYVRAYATNSAGTSYGNEVSFTTAKNAVVPPVVTTAISSITSNSAASGGTISNDGGEPVTARGVCWGTTENPTTAGSKTIDGNGTGTFSSSISGLNPATTYYVRAYATNKMGTGYGNQMSFATIASLSTLSTSEISSVTSNSATGGGNITSDGGSTITARGVCWGTSANPTISGNITNNGSGKGSFTSSLGGLTPATTYYVRAYATNGAGTAYGNQVSFTTLAGLPTLTTTAVTSITTTSAASGGTISSDGGSSVTARGICWSTSVSPTVSNSKTNNGTGTGTFASNLTGLNAGTTYYVRAYATNNAGTGYGNEVSFTTGALLPTLTTTAVTSISARTAISGGNITSDGGSSVTDRGVCWSTTSNPIVSGNHTADGNGIGNFSSSITGLSPLTKYYVRAYAKNSVGVAYGNEVSFTTTDDAVPLAPGNVNAGVNNGTSLYIQWDIVAKANGYDVYWSTSPGVTKANSMGKISDITTNSCVHSDVLINTDYYYVVVAKNENGESNISSEVTARSALLFNEAAITHTGEKQYYQVNVSAGQNLFIQESLGSNVQNFYVYVKYGSVPTSTDYDYKSETGDDEEIHITNTQSGTYYIMVYASYYSSYYSGYYLFLARTRLTVLPFGSVCRRDLNHTGMKSLSEVTVSAGQNLLINTSLSSNVQNYYLYIKYGAMPTPTSFDAKSETGDDEAVNIVNTQSGTYYILVFASYYSSYYSGDYTIRVSR